MLYALVARLLLPLAWWGRLRIDLRPAPAEARTASELLGAVRERVPPVPAGRSR